MALGFARLGRKVYLPSQATDPAKIAATLLPTLAGMLDAGDAKERRIRIDAFGNHWPAFQEIPNRVRVVFAVFEDTAIPDSAIETLRKYDIVLAPSTWIRDLLADRGVDSTVWHQAIDETLFHPNADRRRPRDRLYVFSGGKLEYRKSQDVVIEAFKRFRETTEGEGAVLVTAWQNKWSQTMAGIWESGYVRGVPVMRGPTLDMASWVEANGIPRDAFIDLGFLSQAETANAMRECDIGFFPNRCEGATNLSMVEAQSIGLQCVGGAWCGQADPGVGFEVESTPATLPCSLFKGMEGWREPDITSCVAELQATQWGHRSQIGIGYWTWHEAINRLDDIINA
jgi:glycosyltransferase involved in cell wall biosynthesis